MNIYSLFESKGMYSFQSAKDAFLAPIAGVLLRRNISAHAVSIVAAVTAVGSLIGSIIYESPIIFVVGIWLHLLLDGLDGSVARTARTAGTRSGLLADLMSDSIGIAAMGVYIWHFHYVSAFGSLVFSAAYLGVNYISFALAERGQSYVFIIRPRVYVLLALLVDYFFALDATLVVVAASDLLLGIFVIVGIRKLRLIWSLH